MYLVEGCHAAIVTKNEFEKCRNCLKSGQIFILAKTETLYENQINIHQIIMLVERSFAENVAEATEESQDTTA
jgi:hypothetical protein